MDNCFFNHCPYRTMMLLSETEDKGQSTPSNCNTLQSSGKFIACSCHLSIFTKLLAKYYVYHYCIKSKTTIFITMNMTKWWAMEPWIVLIWWRFHCKGLYPSRIKQQMSSSDSCAVIPVLTIRSGVGRSSQVCYLLSFINGCAYRRHLIQRGTSGRVGVPAKSPR